MPLRLSVSTGFALSLLLLSPLASSIHLPYNFAAHDLLQQRQATADPYDFSYITQWAAIGDSYAAGIGAGNRIGYLCSVYDFGYPQVINADWRMGDPSTRKFTNLACSGALTPAIQSQAEKLSGGQQLITISAGGNDAGLVTVLNDW